MLYGKYQRRKGEGIQEKWWLSEQVLGGLQVPALHGETKHHFSFAKAAQYYLDDVADKYEWRCIGTNEKLPVMEINQIYRYKKG